MFVSSPQAYRAPASDLITALRNVGLHVEHSPIDSLEFHDPRWADWYAELRAAHQRLAARTDVVVAAGLSMGGALVLRLAADEPSIAGVVVVNPAVATKRLDVKLLPVLKHVVPSFPGIANDIKKPGVEEHGYTRTPLKAVHSMMQAWGPLVADLPKVRVPVLYLRSTVDHVVDDSSQGRNTWGVRMIDLDQDDRVGSIARVDAEQAPAEAS